MSGERISDFLVQIQTSSPPTPATPTTSTDVLTKAYAEANFAPIAGQGAPVASNSALRSVGPSDRYMGQERIVTGTGVFWWYDSGSTATDDDQTVLLPSDAPGTGRWLAGTGGSGGAASEWTNIPLGEPLLSTDIPAAVFAAVKQSFVVTASNKFIDFNEGSGDKTATLTEGTYRFDNSYEQAKFLLMIKTAMQAPAGVTGTYTISFDTSTRKITIASTVSHTLKFKTGAHGSDNTDTHAGTLLGFSDTADTSSATSHVADNEITSTLTKKMFLLKTDASYDSRSRSVIGLVTSSGLQYADKSAKYNQTIQGFSGLTEGDIRYTSKASITVSAANNKIDFTEGGGALAATVASGEYSHDGTTDYGGLSTAIKTALQSAGAGTYTVTYDNDTDKFTIVKSAGTFTLKFSTGTNVATSIHTSLGFNTTDLTGSLTYTAQNALALRGKLVSYTSTRFNASSVPFGVAQKSDRIQAKRDAITSYIEVVGAPGDFLSAPDDVTPGYNVTLGDTASNASGQGVRCFFDHSATPEVLRFQYRASANSPWVTSASSFALNTDNALNTTFDNGAQNDVFRAPRIVLDNNGKGVAIAAGQWVAAGLDDVRGFHTTDGGVTWAKVTGNRGGGNDLARDGTNSFHVGGLRQRGNKVVYFISNTAQSGGEFGYMEDTGSGYGTATSQSTSALDCQFFGTGCEIQYFPLEVGANQYRYVFVGRVLGSTTNRLVYMKGDLSGLATINFTATSLDCIAMTCEKNNGGNRIAGLLGGAASSTTLIPFYTSDTYNAGVLTLTEGTTQNSGGTNLSHSNGFQAQDQRHSNWGLVHKMVMINGRAWAVVHHEFTNIHRYQLWTTSDVTTNSWTNLGEVIGSDTTNQQGEMRIIYVPAKNCFVFLWKRGTNSTVLTQNLANGQIFARVVQIESGGASLSYFPAAQIDNAEALGTFQGGIAAHAHNNGIGITWTKSTNILRSQKFA